MSGGHDSEVYDLAGEEMMTDITTHGGFAEIIYAPKGRYEQVVPYRACQPC